jgi:hypothetical protein
MNCTDQCFGILHREWVDLWPVLPLEARTSKTSSRIVLLGMIPIAEIERATKDADGIVVCLLAPGVAICNGDEPGITHLMKEMCPERGADWPPMEGVERRGGIERPRT